MNNRKLFFSYVIPSVLAFALSGVYAIVDGFFIGNSLGDIGLTAINIAYPIPALIQALGTGIGLAGAIRFAILRAQEKSEEEQQYFSGTILLLAVISAVVSVAVLLLTVPALRLLGAEGEILTIAREYVIVVAIGAVFQIFGTGLVPFIRNLGGATFAMGAMIAGFFTNIVLDYLFVWVFGWGMTGAAVATVIGQGVTMLGTLIFLLRKKMRFVMPPMGNLPAIFRTVLLMSFSPFGLTFSPNITLILMNRFLMIYGGEKAVAAYACIAYITAIVYLLLQGIGDGSQPLISRYYGEKAIEDMKQVRTLAYKSGCMIALACMAALFLLRGNVGILFGASAAVSRDVAAMLPLFLTTLLFLSFVRITTAYFYATEQSRLSYVLVYAEPVLLLVLSILLPQVMGVIGVWISVPLAQCITWVIAWFAKRWVDRSMHMESLAVEGDMA